MKQAKPLKRAQKEAIDRFGDDWTKYNFRSMDKEDPNLMVLEEKATGKEVKIPLKGGKKKK